MLEYKIQFDHPSVVWFCLQLVQHKESNMLGLNIKLLGIQTLLLILIKYVYGILIGFIGNCEEWRTINNNNNLLAYTVDVITYKLYKN